MYICVSVISLISCGIRQIGPISAGQRDIFVGWRAHLTYDLTFDIHFNIVLLIISYIRTIYIFCSYIRVYNAHMDNSYCKNIRLINIFARFSKRDILRLMWGIVTSSVLQCKRLYRWTKELFLLLCKLNIYIKHTCIEYDVIWLFTWHRLIISPKGKNLSPPCGSVCKIIRRFHDYKKKKKMKIRYIIRSISFSLSYRKNHSNENNCLFERIFYTFSGL